MWLFLLLMCVSYLHAVLHGGEGTSKPSSDHNEIEDSILQEYPKYANMDFSDGHLQALLKTSQNYPISKLYNKYSTTQKIDQIGEDANADFAANTELHNICQEIMDSGNPNLDCSKLNRIYQEEVKECLKRHDERNQISKSIFTNPDNSFNKTKMNPIPIPQFSSLQQPQAHPLITQLGGPAVMSHSPLSSLPIPGATSTMGFGSTQKEIGKPLIATKMAKAFNNFRARMRELIKQKSNIGDNSNGINIASQQIKDLQQKQANPLIPQSGRLQLTQTLPPVPHFFAQDSLNHRKESNPQYARKLPLHVRKQNQPQQSRPGTNLQKIIAPTNAQNQQQQTQHDKTPIPFHQQSAQIQPQPQHVVGQNQQIHQQNRVVEDHPFHPKYSLKQQHDRTYIPYIPIDGHSQQYVGTNNAFSPTIGNISHQYLQNVETNIPFYSTSGQKQKQMHQQHVETNNHFRTELRRLSFILTVGGGRHNVDDEIVEKRTLDEYEHMPENVAKRSKGKGVVQHHGSDFVGHQVQGLGTPNLPHHLISAEDFVHDDVFNKHYEELMQYSNANPLPYNFHQGIHGFNNAGEHGMSGTTSQMVFYFGN
uniref:Uncharacterized protein n=1 Tax=Meloidogyne javanica TaxID=6303 RepID=A0A915LQR7_MELJA